MKIEDKEKKEINFWKEAPEENPEVFSIPNLINKFKEADIFFEKLVIYQEHFRKANNILELGGGQGWAACMVKFYHPGKHVVTSDISPFAVESAVRWEELFKVNLDGRLAFRSYETPMQDKSQDLVFCFASAHHFVKHQKTFEEMNRILRKGGTILYLYEPVCRRYIYKLSFTRANWKRPQVPEDVLIYKRIIRIARANGFSAHLRFSPSTKNRGVFGALYYWTLSRLPFLQRLLPCTADLVFIKNRDL